MTCQVNATVQCTLDKSLLQGIRNTRSCITGHPVPVDIKAEAGELPGDGVPSPLHVQEDVPVPHRNVPLID